MEKEIYNRNLMVNNNYEDGISNINKLIHYKYLSSSGNTDLKIRLFRISSHLPDFQICLEVSYKGDTSKVSEIALKCTFDEERIEKDKIPLIENEVNSYFKEIGFKTTNATSYEEMIDLIERLAKDVPQVKHYFDYV